MSMLQELHQAHLARQWRLGAFPPAIKQEPKPPVPVVAPIICKPPAPVEYKPRWYWISHTWLGDSEGLVEPAEAPRILMSQVVDAVCKYYGITLVEIKSKRRTKVIAHQRQVAMYLVKEMTGQTLPQIGRHLGGRDHTTILHGIRQITKRLDDDSRLAAEIAEIKAAVRA